MLQIDEWVPAMQKQKAQYIKCVEDYLYAKTKGTPKENVYRVKKDAKVAGGEMCNCNIF